MKKNILFVIPSLIAAGGERSLINLLSQINFNLYNVDLFLLKPEGIFMELVPQEVRILPLPETYSMFTLSLFNSVKSLLLKGKVSVAYNRIAFCIKNRICKSTAIREQANWRYVAKSIDKIEKKYDIAIGYMEKTSIYFCVDKVDADKKIGWIHIDYDMLGMDPNFDIGYFRKLNNLITVSEECASVLKNRFPSEQKKIGVIYNIVSPTVINQLANQEIDVYHKKNDEIVVLSIGRLHYQKYFELAIESCKKLIDKGYNLRWYIIGEGEERNKLTKLIKTYNLEDNFKLLGLISNPYPYIKQADIYAQTSRFEGKSIAIDEAKILNKPIIVTNFSTAKDQINNGIDGLIVEMETCAVVEGIEKLINNTDLKKSLLNNLSKEKLGTEEEVNKLYELF